MSEKETPSQLVYSLWHVGRSSFEKAEKLNEQLAKTTYALNETVRVVPGTVAAQVKSTLSHIASDAALAIASEWTEANTHAEKATEAYRSAISDARKNISIAAALLFAALALVVIILGFRILPSWDEQSAMRAQKAQLELTIQQLTKQGALANVLPCKDSSGHDRLCVQTDESARVPKGLRVIKGY